MFNKKDCYIRFSNINSSFKCDKKQYKILKNEKWRYTGTNIKTDIVTEDGKRTTKTVNAYLKENGVKDNKLFSMHKISDDKRLQLKEQMNNRKK